MTAMTEDEGLAFLQRNEWITGISADVKGLRYPAPEANALQLRFPETPLRATYFARLVSMLGAEDESMFDGAKLWITLSDIGSPQLEKAGWAMVEMMRRGFGELRPLSSAPVHSFRSDERAELASFILPCFIFAWDAFVVPSGGNLFIHISHDEYWTVVTRDAETYNSVVAGLNDLKPQPANQRLLAKFCPASRHTVR